MMTRIRGLLALAGLAGIIVGLPAVLIAVNHIGAPRFGWTLNGVLQALASPDDGTLALTVLKAAGWVSWAILTLAITVEIVARGRHLPVPRLRGLRMPQSLARGMVATAAALFVAAGTMTAAAPFLALPQPAELSAPANPAHHGAAGKAHAAPQQKEPKARSWIVKRGDTLSEIALETTDKAANYPRLFKASKATTQPDGRHLSDPDLILPGWKITIPADRLQVADKKAAQTRTPTTSTPTRPAPRPDPPSAAPRLPSTATPATPSVSVATQKTAPTESLGVPTNSQAPAWLLSGLAGAGALLAGGLWVALRRRRAAQSRSRRPGRTIAGPDPALAPVEKTLHHQGAPTGELVLAIDNLLRRLVATLTGSVDELPVLVGLDVSHSAFTVRFHRSATLPQPWTCLDGDDSQVWRIGRDIDPEQVGPLQQDSPPPWPQLVCLGADRHGWRLVNLEAFGIISLTGDATYAADLARYLGIELAVSPWARDVEIDCLDICPELASIDPSRVRYHCEPGDVIPGRVAAAIRTAERLTEHHSSLETARVGFAGDELWDSRILISGRNDVENLDVLTELIADQPGRTATAVLLVVEPARHCGLTMRLTDDGRLHVPELGLDLVVNGLTEDEARGCAALLAAGQDIDDQAIPAIQTSESSWAAMANAAGSIRDELTLSRASEATGATSLLPEPDETYLDHTANTESDLETLAPLVPAEVTARVEAVDAALDRDLQQWWADACVRPRVQVLGPVKVRVGRTGDPLRAAARSAYYSEIVAYLCTRPDGATTSEVSDAFGLTQARVRRDMSTVRGWLGVDEHTGEPFLPEAMRAPQAIERGVGLYTVQGVLCDADLYRRLRLRGQARGKHGLDDLRQALRLVNGAPFDAMRSKGGIWLSETRLDQHLLCAIVDVAHIVSTITIESGDLDQARAAAQLAALAAPNETIPQLDLAAILASEGRHAAAAEVARKVVDWRGAGGEPPTDLSTRTEQILATHRWLTQGNKAS